MNPDFNAPQSPTQNPQGAPAQPVEPNNDWISAALPPVMPAAPVAPVAPAPLPSPYASPMQPAMPYQAPAPQGDGTGGLIPYKNPRALLSYYIGLFSLVPGLSYVMAPAAIVLGVMGLKYAKQNPIVKGQVHAWIGIICGTLWTAVYYGALLLILASAGMRR
jgi:hypothetical protein